MAELLRLVPFALCAFVLPAPTQSQVPGTSGPDSLVGCYRLLYADGKVVFRDAAFTTSLVRLDSVRTPDVARRTDQSDARAVSPVRRGTKAGVADRAFALTFFVPYWYVRADTLHIVRTDGFNSEHIRLNGSAQHLTGDWRYFTDVIDPRPQRHVSVSAERTQCLATSR